MYVAGYLRGSDSAAVFPMGWDLYSGLRSKMTGNLDTHIGCELFLLKARYVINGRRNNYFKSRNNIVGKMVVQNKK